MRAWTLAVLLPSLSLAFDECLTPTLENGWIEAAPGSGPESFVGRFRCREGFLLSGESRVKCRAGVWSQATLPVCTALLACPEEQLPSIENGYRRGVAKLQNSVFRYKCYSGFRLMGARSVHCDGHNWVTTELPICTRRGCDPADLFGSEVAQIEHGRVRSIYGGAAYRFKCNHGALMSGDRTVFCDGHHWNSSRPDCLVPPATPVLSLEPRHGGSVQVGQRLTFSCRSQGGNPSPSLAFMMNNQPAAAENGRDGEIFLSIVVGEQHQGAQVVCTAINSVSRRPVYSQFHLIRIQFAPTEVYLTGPSLAMPGDLLSFSCNSDEADPSPDLIVVALDETGTRLPAAAQEPQPSMKTSRGWVSSTRMHFQTGSGTKRVEVQCVATNAMGEASTSVATQMQYFPEEVEVEGPSDVTTGEEAEFFCLIGPAFPKPRILWTKRSGNSVTEVAEEETEVDVVQLPHGVSQVSRLTLTAEGDMEELTLGCTAVNPGTGERKTSELHRVAFSYPSTTTTTTTTVESTTSTTAASTSTESKLTEYEYTYEEYKDELQGDEERSSESHEEDLFEADDTATESFEDSVASSFFSSSLPSSSASIEVGQENSGEEGASNKDLKIKKESFDNEMNSNEDVEGAVRKSYEDSKEEADESYGEEPEDDEKAKELTMKQISDLKIKEELEARAAAEALEATKETEVNNPTTNEDSYEDLGSDEYGDEDGSWDEDYEEFYDDEEELLGADQDDMYNEEDSSESHTRVSELEDGRLGKIENDSDPVEERKVRKFSDLNGLTDLASHKKNDGIAKQQDSDPNSMTRGKLATKGDFHEGKDKVKQLDFSDEKSWEKSSMGGSFHSDNLNAVHSEDIEMKKGLKSKNEEGTWISGDALEANWEVEKKIKEADNVDQGLFLGKYLQEPEENSEFLAAVAADTPTFNLKSSDQRPLTADFSPKTLQSNGVQGSNGLHMFLFAIVLARILA